LILKAFLKGEILVSGDVGIKKPLTFEGLNHFTKSQKQYLFYIITLVKMYLSSYESEEHYGYSWNLLS
jgi:hypothetical protein